MNYKNTIAGKFIIRPNRFIAKVDFAKQKTEGVTPSASHALADFLREGAPVVLTG